MRKKGIVSGQELMQMLLWEYAYYTFKNFFSSFILTKLIKRI